MTQPSAAAVSAAEKLKPYFTNNVTAAESIGLRGATISTISTIIDAEFRDLVQALREIRSIGPRPFEEMPDDWAEQVAACAECQSYAGHPIQAGICNTHRQPLWDRDKHGYDEMIRLSDRMAEIARATLAKHEAKP